MERGRGQTVKSSGEVHSRESQDLAEDEAKRISLVRAERNSLHATRGFRFAASLVRSFESGEYACAPNLRYSNMYFAIRSGRPSV